MKTARILSLCAIGIGAVVLFLTSEKGAAVRNTLASTSDDLLNKLKDQSGKAMDGMMDGMKDMRKRATAMMS